MNSVKMAKGLQIKCNTERVTEVNGIVSGATVKTNQLINPANYPANTAYNNVTFIKLADNSIQVVVGEGGCSSRINYFVETSMQVIPNHKYLLKGSQANGNSTTYRTIANYNNVFDAGNGVIIANTYATEDIKISIYAGCPAGTYIFKPNLIDLTLCGDDNLSLTEAMAKYNEFYPYIPDPILLYGYYKGIKLDMCSYIDRNTKVKHIGGGIVDLGTLTVILESATDHTFYLKLSDIKPQTDETIAFSGICNKYQTVKASGGNQGIDKSISSYNGWGNDITLRIKDSAYTDATTFKQAIQGVMLNYELATAIESNIEEF